MSHSHASASIALAALFLAATVSPALASLPALAAPRAAVLHVEGSSAAFGTPGGADWDTYVVPDYQGLLGDLLWGGGAAEPSGGVCWRTSATNPAGTDVFFFKTMTGVGRATFDDAATPATAAWSDASRLLVPEGHHLFADPILHTDETTCRTWAGHMQLPDPCTNDMAFRDEDPAAVPVGNPVDGWTLMPALCQLSSADHETIGSGPYSRDLPVPQDMQGSLYPHIVYYCAQILSAGVGVGIKANSCAQSFDGGVTWPLTEPSWEYTDAPDALLCAGIFGHVKVGNEGYAAIPYRQCYQGTAGLELSRNNGLTWDAISVPGIADTGHFDPSLAWSRVNPAGADSRLYFAQALPDGLWAAVSGDFGLTWSAPQRVSDSYAGPNGETITRAEFANTESGDADRAAVSFLGTTDTTGADAWSCSAPEEVVWHMYVARTFDGGATWSVERASGDPVQIGGIWPAGGSEVCRNLLDFNDLDLGSDGRLYVSFADGCVAPACFDGAVPGTSRSAQGTVIRQSSGCGLLSAYDAPGSDCTATVAEGNPELAVTSPSDGASVGSAFAVNGTADRNAGTATPDLAASAGGPYTGGAGSPIGLAATATGGTGPYACAWSGAGAAFVDAGACATTATFAAAGAHTVHVDVTDAAGDTAGADATVAVTLPSTGPSCLDDGAADTLAPDPAGLYDLVRVCGEEDAAAGTFTVTIATAGLAVDDAAGAAVSPVVYTVSVDSKASGWDAYRAEGGFGVWDNNAAGASAGTATSDGTKLTITLPLSETGDPSAFSVTTSVGEGLFGIPLAPMDDAPDAAMHPLAQPLLGGTRATDPTGDAGCPQLLGAIGPVPAVAVPCGTPASQPYLDITAVGVAREDATTLDVTLAVDDMTALPPAASPGVGPQVSYTAEFCTDTHAATYASGAYSPRADGVCYRLSAVHGLTADAFDASSIQADSGGACGLSGANSPLAAGSAFDLAAGTVTWRLLKAKLNVNAISASVQTCATAPPTHAANGAVDGDVLSLLSGKTSTTVGVFVQGAGASSTNYLLGDTTNPALAEPYTLGGGGGTVTAPGAVADLAAAAGDGQATLSWSAPANGGSPITGYTVHYGTAAGSHPSTQAASGTTATVAGLANGQAYFFTVTATNAAGTGAASNEATATPSACPASGERVLVLEGTACLGGTALATAPGSGPAAWSVDVAGLASGAHTLDVRWLDADGATLGSATRSVTVAGTTSTSTSASTSTSGTGSTGGSTTGPAGGTVNNVAPAIDALAATPSIAVIGRDGEVGLAGAAHDDNGHDDVAGVTVKVTAPSGGFTTPAATLTHEAADATALTFAASTPISAETPTGTYQVDAFATDAAGVQSPVVAATFTVLPPPSVAIGYTGTANRLDFGSFDPGASNVASGNEVAVRNEMHATQDFLFDMTDFTCTRGAIPVLGNAKVHVGHLDGGAFVADLTLDYTQSTVDLGTLGDGAEVLLKLELLSVPKGIAGACTASFGLYHT